MTPLPSQLPPEDSQERWPWLQRLRRSEAVATGPWLEALEQGLLPAASDLVAVLVEKLDGAGSARLLRWWLSLPDTSEPAEVAHRQELLDLLGRRRDPACAAQLRAAVAERPNLALLPLLGHQRDSQDFARLEHLARQPGPSPLRRAALEGLAVGLSAWPQAALQQLLLELCSDLDGALASQAVDLLARLPSGRQGLERVLASPLDPGAEARARRRLAALPRSPLLLVVHGRAGGVIPEELQALALDLERRRRAPVRLQPLSGSVAQADPAAPGLGNAQRPLTLVPLLLLPGTHVRQDIPAIAAAWRRHGPVRRLPFLGAWPSWQAAIADELADLAASHGQGSPPLLLHHPLEPGLADRYLAHLARRCSATCQAAPYTATDLEDLTLAIRGAALPLALAANRLTESLPAALGAPLLQRPRFQSLLLDQLEALP
ncbi:CbiX/SirB N-terminal domain-containing protein [Synechococcus sp. J7-Johnson]|uniref:CbiX/SirB N-terminal domain-containing protein n=1 Tax=Synechococcus sp. J7-Johnson TaxID=2823737 RepID=UPI0020CF95F0|nr:CbiX/SirB N-terminal domain-containing protein [Synechococcus sp. J7-Johnson]